MPHASHRPTTLGRKRAAASVPRRVSFRLAVAMLIAMSLAVLMSEADETSRSSNASSRSIGVATQSIKLPIVDGNDIRFARLSGSQGLSQVRVSQIIQDDQGFIWFGTQNGLNRYDGYNFKVFKHNPRDPESLSGVYVYSLFKDRTGAIWVGTDQLLDRFDPLTEKFHHYSFDAQKPTTLATTVNHISQDSSGMLWLSTGRGLFRLNPASGRTTQFRHDPNDASTVGDNDIKSTGTDRVGTFWVATRRSLDELDGDVGKVKRRISLSDSGMGAWFHEDRFGVFWLIYSDGVLATFDREANSLIRYSLHPEEGTGGSKNPVYAMLEDSKGTMWFGTGGDGLLKFDRERRIFVRYNHRAGDTDSLADTRVTTLFEDREGNIWTGLHQVEPNFFATKPPPFEKFTYQAGNPNSLGSPLVSVLYEDRKGVLWVGADRLLKHINRKTGQYSTFDKVVGNEVLSIVEEGPDTLWFGTGGQGLQRYDLRTGQIKVYRHDPADPSTLCSDLIERLLLDHNGTLWAASWEGLCKFDASSGTFSTYWQDPLARGLNYQAIAEDHRGDLWLGSNLGLQRFEPGTGKFTAYGHKLDDPKSLSANRVNSVFLDHTGAMWIGTQNGLDQFEPQTGKFTLYGERDGMAGNVVSCILEDHRSRLWMSTNKGVSSFELVTKRFNNYTVADGLPGADLTGWGACFKSATGEMFFGGFSGATAFFPDKVGESSYVPPILLTDFRLFGAPVSIGGRSPLRKSINYTDSITLSNSQNMFSIEFSALSYLNAATHRYRYMLEGLDQQWNEVGGDRRVASYTTLPTGVYAFRVQGATSRGAWSEPGATLRINILPPWWNTWWFRATCAVLLILIAATVYSYRLRQIARQFEVRLEERVNERTRIARELHDTLLQSFQGLLLHFQRARNLLPERGAEAIQTLDRALDGAEQAIVEGRDAIHDLRSPAPAAKGLVEEIKSLGEELVAKNGNKDATQFRVVIEGTAQTLNPNVHIEIFRIAREALRNAFSHSRARRIETEVAYSSNLFRLRIRDDGKGMAPDVRNRGQRIGHWGLGGMRERAERLGGELEMWSEPGAGTEVDLRVPASIAYQSSPARKNVWLICKKKKNDHEDHS